MGAPRETPQQKAGRLALQAAAQIQNPQERKQFLQSVGYVQDNRGNLAPASGYVPTTQTAQRVVAAFEATPSTTQMTKGGQVTTYNAPGVLQNLGETVQQEYARKEAEARAFEQRPFVELAAAEEALRQQQAAYQAQLAEEGRLKAQYAAELQATEAKARVAGKRSVATSARARSQAQTEAAQLQQQEQKTALQAQQLARTERAAGATVGQPGRSRTRVSTGLGIGGYGGTAAARVSPTGLNI